MTDERIPDDIMRTAVLVARDLHDIGKPWTLVIARAILAERNRIHKQLKGEV